VTDASVHDSQKFDGLLSSVTETTDFLAPDILDECGRAVPPVPHALRRTLTTILRRIGTGSIAQRLIAAEACNYLLVLGRRLHIRIRRGGGDDRSLKRAVNDGRAVSSGNERPITDGITSSRHHHVATAAGGAHRGADITSSPRHGASHQRWGVRFADVLRCFDQLKSQLSEGGQW